MSESFLEKQKEFFELYADTRFAQHTDNKADAIEWQRFLEVTGPLEGRRILEIGCGSGRYALRIAEKAAFVVGIDLSKKAVQMALDSAKEKGLSNFSAQAGDFKTFDFTENFDIIVAVNVLHHNDDNDSLFQKAKEVLKAGGKVVIVETNSLNPLFIPFFILIKQFQSHFTKNYLINNLFGLKRLFKHNGFQVDKLVRHGMLPTGFYNFSSLFKLFDDTANKLPLLNYFSAFYFFSLSLKDESL